MWLAATATLCAAVGLLVLASAPLIATASLSPTTRAAAVISTFAVLVAAWLTASTPLAFGRGAVTSLLAIAVTAPLVVGWTDGPMSVRILARSAALFATPLILHLLVTGLSRRTRRHLRGVLWVAYGATTICAAAILLTRNSFYDVRCWEDCAVPPVITGVPLLLTGLGRWRSSSSR